MDKQKLLGKREAYAAELLRLESKDFSVEIEPKVEEYRNELLRECKENCEHDKYKLLTYLELLDRLISEAESEPVGSEEVDGERDYVEPKENDQVQ